MKDYKCKIEYLNEELICSSLTINPNKIIIIFDYIFFDI